MPNRLLFFVLVLLPILVCHIGQGESLSPEVAKRSLVHAAKILREFPPDKYYVIALGVSNPAISSGLRALIGDTKLADHYLLELPVTEFHLSRANSKTIAEKVFPQKPLTGDRKPVLLRVLHSGGVITSLSQKIKGGDPINAYIIWGSALEENDSASRLRETLSTNLGGRVLDVRDEAIVTASVVERVSKYIYEGVSRKKEGNIPTFTRFESMSFDDFMEGKPLVEKSIWRDLDSEMKAHIHKDEVPVALSSVRTKLKKIAKASVPLYSHYQVQLRPCGPLENVK
jgi:hypothetical protein